MFESSAAGLPSQPKFGALSRRPAAGCAARRHAAFACLIAASLAAPLAAQPGFTIRVTPGLISAYTQKFGGGVSERIAGWVDFARDQKAAPRIARLIDTPGAELDALRTVNLYFKRIPFVQDPAHWGVEDYWATPAEMFASNGGDCEDYSLAKYFLLKELGVPVGRLRITYVKAIRLNQAHMVLAYYATPGAEPLILDNLEDAVRLASERPDLVPVYSFNDEDLVLVQGARKGNPSVIRAWRDLLRKLEAETHL